MHQSTGRFGVRVSAWVIAGLLATGGFASTAGAVVNGTLDLTRDAVGVVIADGVSCTGVLISKNLVLTVAYCVEGAVSIEFRIGDDRYNPDYSVSAVVEGVHSLWPSNPDFAVALIRLLTSDTGFKPILLLRPWQDQLFIGDPAVLVGYGLISYLVGSTSRRHSGSIVFSDVQPSQLWSHISSGSGACSGDSGGPVLIQIGALEFHAGTIRYVTSSACDDFTVYTRSSAVWEGFLDNALGEVGMIFADDFETGAASFWN